MTNLWGFLLQTLYVSLVGGLLLLVKWLLQDKLTPRWQYGVWGVLALRILIPVQFVGKYILLPLPLWVETIKTLIEPHLSSAYTSAYLPATIKGPIPLLSAPPESVTDWLFVLYAAGVAVVLLRYVFSYLRLRWLLHTGSPAPEETERQIELVAERYQLKSCRAVVIPNLPSPMVCGVFRPVMALPAEKKIDSHVLLHELLHVKYGDALQSIVWCVFRALHWCNPLVQYFMNRIGNDMESLCDQRVLEWLEGEERRNYGVSLLAMANDRYPRAPGTTSVSNGGKNISWRIQAIVRFKRYPKGMALASVCVSVMLFCGSFFGTTYLHLEESSIWNDRHTLIVAASFAKSHLVRCTTIAGALDTYAKGLLQDNGLYLMSASPSSRQKELEIEMRSNREADPEYNFWFRIAEESDAIVFPALDYQKPSEEGTYKTDISFRIDRSQYGIYNLKQEEDGTYSALIVLFVSSIVDNGRYLSDEHGYERAAYLIYPVQILKENGFVVTETGDRELRFLGENGSSYLASSEISQAYHYLPPLAKYKAVGKSGTISMEVSTCYTVNDIDQTANEIWTDPAPNPAAEVGMIMENRCVEYIFSGSEETKKQMDTVALQTAELQEDGTIPEFSSELSYVKSTEGEIESGGSSSNGELWCVSDIKDDWNGELFAGGGSSYSGEEIGSYQPPKGFVARIFWNKEAQETLILREVE